MNPDVPFIGADTVKAEIMSIFSLSMEKMKDIYKKIPARASFTSDIWTSRNNKAFMAITCHYIDENWTLNTHLVNFAPIQGSHTGFNLAQSMYQILRECGLHEKLLAFTLDNASNNKTMLEELQKCLLCDGINWEHKLNYFRCFAHILNLAVQDAMSSLTDIVQKVCDFACLIGTQKF